jgi:hypothetical protein
MDEEPRGPLGAARIRPDRRLVAAGRRRRWGGDPPMIPCASRATRAVRSALPLRLVAPRKAEPFTTGRS